MSAGAIAPPGARTLRLLTVALTTGALLILFAQTSRQHWTNPGTLTNAHASAAKCSDCHSVEPAATRLLSVSLGERAREDSALCLKCHELGDQPFHPHGLAPATLVQLQSRLTPPLQKHEPVFLRASRVVTAGNSRTGDLACATCHQEHHGRNFDLTRLSNAQCQTCHATQFASFKKGHPEFAGYPYERRTRIFFDHASHLQQHFAEQKEKAPRGCQSCHTPGPAGRFMEVKNFNLTCAACHSAQIQGEGMTNKGVAFFTIPGLDAETLAQKGISVGEWPKFADAKLTPYMELLLQRDPKARAAIEKLRGLDLLDLTKATPEELTAAEQFAWSVKSLLFHLVVEGQPYLREEMKGEVAPAGLEIPRAALIAAQREWMPGLLTEVQNYEKGIKPQPPKTISPTPTPASAQPKEKSGGDESLLGHGDLLAESSPTPVPSPSDTAAGGDLLAGDNDLTKAPSPSPASNGDLLAEGGDLLAGGETLSPQPASPTPAPTPESIKAEDWGSISGRLAKCGGPLTNGPRDCRNAECFPTPHRSAKRGPLPKMPHRRKACRGDASQLDAGPTEHEEPAFYHLQSHHAFQSCG